jgi:hypothetical protein
LFSKTNFILTILFIHKIVTLLELAESIKSVSIYYWLLLVLLKFIFLSWQQQQHCFFAMGHYLRNRPGVLREAFIVNASGLADFSKFVCWFEQE